MYFYARGDPANLRNRQVQTREKRRMSAQISCGRHVTLLFTQKNRIKNGRLSMQALPHTIQNPALNGDRPSDVRIAANC
jgi:hypothetical protein